MKSSLYQAGSVVGAWGPSCSTARGVLDWTCVPCIARLLHHWTIRDISQPSLYHFSTNRSQAIKIFLLFFQILLLTVLTNVLLQVDYPPCPFYSQDFFHDNPSAWAGLHLSSPSMEILSIFKGPLDSTSCRYLPGAPRPIYPPLYPYSHRMLTMCYFVL